MSDEKEATPAKLGKEQIVQGIVKPLVTLLAFGLSFLKNKELLDEVVDEAAAQITALKTQVENPPSMEDALSAVFDVAETVADTTESKVDDVVVDTAKGLLGGQGLLGAIKGVIELGKAHRADRRSKKASKAETAESHEEKAVDEAGETPADGPGA